jgi:hypothetical protein
MCRASRAKRSSWTGAGGGLGSTGAGAAEPASSAPPQSGQKRQTGSTRAPQLGHAASAGAPQAWQNFRPGSSSVPHCAQLICKDLLPEPAPRQLPSQATMAPAVKLVTWNVNSIRQRQERLVALLARHAPDVVCLQETKATDADFPAEAVRAAGYQFAHAGQKTYNGVAILAREPLADLAVGLRDGGDDAQARLLAATVQGVRVISAYAPNGQSVGSDKYAYKLDWFARLRRMLERECAPS